LRAAGVMLLPQAERERALALHEKCESMPTGPVVPADECRARSTTAPGARTHAKYMRAHSSPTRQSSPQSPEAFTSQ
jgi:hypothetical protein